jgi:hypothetical protein
MSQSKKGRPPTKKVGLKEGFYIEVKNKGSQSGIKLRKENMMQVEMAIKQYEKIKIVQYVGQVKNGKWLDGKFKGQKTAS